MTARYINPSSSGGDGTTNNESGGTAAYVSQASLIANEAPFTLTDVWDIYCDSGSSNLADTAKATWAGFTTTASNDITVQPNTGNFHAGVYSASIYRHEPDDFDACVIDDDFIKFYKIQLSNTRSGTGAIGVGIKLNGAYDGVILDGCIVRYNGTTTGSGGDGINFDQANAVNCGCINTLSYDWKNSGFRVRATSSSEPNFFYNCTSVDNGAYGYDIQNLANANEIFKNCLAFGNASGGWDTTTVDTTNSTNNAADAAASAIPGSNSVDVSSYSAAQIFNDPSNDDFTLGGGTGSDQLDTAGADLDGDSIYPVTEDFIGTTRHATTPSIGCHEYVSAADIAITPPQGNVAVTTTAPTVVVSGGVVITVPQGSLALSTLAPFVSINFNIEIPSVDLSITPNAPSVGIGLAVPGGNLSLSTTAPAVQIAYNITVPHGTLAFSATAPIVGGDFDISVPGGNLSTSTTAPTANVTENIDITVPVGDLSVDSTAPILGGNIDITVPAADLSISSNAPTVRASIEVPQADIALSTTAPLVGTGFSVVVPAGTISISTVEPFVTYAQFITVPYVDLGLTTDLPGVRESIEVPSANISISTTAPFLLEGFNVPVPTVDLAISTLAPTVEITTNVVSIPTGLLALTTTAPLVLSTSEAIISPPTAEMSLVATAPRRYVLPYIVGTARVSTTAPGVEVSSNETQSASAALVTTRP